MTMRAAIGRGLRTAILLLLATLPDVAGAAADPPEAPSRGGCPQWDAELRAWREVMTHAMRPGPAPMADDVARTLVSIETVSRAMGHYEALATNVRQFSCASVAWSEAHAHQISSARAFIGDQQQSLMSRLAEPGTLAATPISATRAPPRRRPRAQRRTS